MLTELLAELYAHSCYVLTFRVKYKKAGGSGAAKVKGMLECIDKREEFDI